MSDPKLDYMKRPQSPNRSSHHPDPGHHTWSLLLLHGICRWLCLKNIKIVFASLKQTTPGLKALPWIIRVSKGEKHPRKAPVLMNHKPKLEQATGFAPHSARCPCSEMSEPVQVQMTVRQCQDSVQLPLQNSCRNLSEHSPAHPEFHSVFSSTRFSFFPNDLGMWQETVDLSNAAKQTGIQAGASSTSHIHCLFA